MAGRQLCSDSVATARGFHGEDCAQRRKILRETLSAFEESRPRDRLQNLALENLKRWKAAAVEPISESKVSVLKGDWGNVTQEVTKLYGSCFAVLNMANAYCPGGAYVEGAIAQEENMYRRTDCHFYVGEDEYDPCQDRYYPEMTRLISAVDGEVYLDVSNPRVCTRGAEDRRVPDLGYPWLDADQVFPFYELRSAAQDLRDGSEFDVADGRLRISAQLDTAIAKGIRHVVLGAHGCGAFQNPAEKIAQIYKEEITAREAAFDAVVFAIFSAGYGPDNYTPFATTFGGSILACD